MRMGMKWLCKQMDVLYILTILISILQFSVKALPLTALRPIDDVIRVQLIEYTQGRGLAEGLVLAGTIVEGGPIYGRRRRILGGKYAHPGLEYINHLPPLESCPAFLLGYNCMDWVKRECQVVRHLYLRSKLCTCKVNVCK